MFGAICVYFITPHLLPLANPNEKDAKYISDLNIPYLDITCSETPIFPLGCIPVYSCEHMVSKIGNDFLFVMFTFLWGASPDSWVDSFPIELPE